jgi:hypothetical protein
VPYEKDQRGEKETREKKKKEIRKMSRVENNF